MQDITVNKGDRLAFNNFGQVNLGTVQLVEPTDAPGFWNITIAWDDGYDDTGFWVWPDEDFKRVR